MSSRTEELTLWVYQGIWGVLASCFRVPKQPPNLPVQAGERIESFHPADGFLRYLKLQFWVLLIAIDAAVFVVWALIALNVPLVGIVLAIPALVVAVVPDVVAYIAIHLRYDTTWYVMSDRSLRIRRGIWVIRETTITFENVQNVTVSQGPLQRWFGIADVFVETAGGGGRTQPADHQGQMASAHQGLIEGVANATHIRDLLLNRIRGSRSAGLGDEESGISELRSRWTPEHMAVLRDIRDAARSLTTRCLC